MAHFATPAPLYQIIFMFILECALAERPAQFLLGIGIPAEWHQQAVQLSGSTSGRNLHAPQGRARNGIQQRLSFIDSLLFPGVKIFVQRPKKSGQRLDVPIV